MAVTTHRRSKGPLGAGAMKGITASTHRGWGTVMTDFIAVGGSKLVADLGSGQGGSGRLPLRTCSSNRTGENPPSGMRAEPGGNVVRFLNGTLAGAPLGYPTSRRSEGPLGDVGSEKAEACVSARFAKGYYHAKKGPVAELLPKANRKPLADPGIGWGEAGRRWLTDGHVCFQPDR